MQIIRSTSHLPQGMSLGTRGSVVTIGNFDGVHRGHQAILARVVQHAAEDGFVATAMVFEPTPREHFDPSGAPPRLQSLREKLASLASAGIERTVILRFDDDFAALSPGSFVEQLLVRGLNVKHMVIGDDFRFGARRAGDFQALNAFGAEFGFTVEAAPTLADAGVRVSSSAIRAALAAADLDRSAELLGRRYTIDGRVVHGEKRGRTLGFPTANVALKRSKPALSGVFVVKVVCDEKIWDGVANIGTRPTVSGKRASLEAHLFDCDENLYGKHMTVEFRKHLRPELKFEDLPALKKAIAEDIRRAHEWLDDQP